MRVESDDVGVDISDARKRLPRLVEMAAAGEDVIVGRKGILVVRIARLEAPRPLIRFVLLKGGLSVFRTTSTYRCPPEWLRSSKVADALVAGPSLSRSGKGSFVERLCSKPDRQGIRSFTPSWAVGSSPCRRLSTARPLSAGLDE